MCCSVCTVLASHLASSLTLAMAYTSMANKRYSPGILLARLSRLLLLARHLPPLLPSVRHLPPLFLSTNHPLPLLKTIKCRGEACPRPGAPALLPPPCHPCPVCYCTTAPRLPAGNTTKTRPGIPALFATALEHYSRPRPPPELYLPAPYLHQQSVYSPPSASDPLHARSAGQSYSDQPPAAVSGVLAAIREAWG